MANRIVALRDAVSIPQSGAQLANAIEDDLGAVRGLHSLTAWISEARSLIDSLKLNADIYPTLNQELRSSGVLFGCASWGDEESNGLTYLDNEIRMHLDAIQAAAGLCGQGTTQ